MHTNFNSYNESMKDKLKGKSEEDIYNSIDKLSSQDKLEKACQYGIMSLVKQTLDDGADPSDNYNTPIIFASVHGHSEIVKKLLRDERVDPSDVNDWAIRYSSENGHLDVVKELMKDKRVNPSDNNNQAIYRASENGHLDVVKELLKDERVVDNLDSSLLKKYKEQIEQIDESLKDKLKGKTDDEVSGLLDNLLSQDQLEISIENNYLNGVIKAINNGAIIDNDILSKAVMSDNINIVDFLYKKGNADIHTNSDFLLRWCASHGNLDMLKYITDKGGDVNKYNSEGFRLAVEYDYYDIVKYYLDNNFININTIKNFNLINKSIDHGYFDIAKILDNYVGNHMLKKESLRTQKGTVIKRYKEVGKKMGNDLYFHKNYVNEYIDSNYYNKLKSYLPEGVNFNIIKYNNKDNYISFISSPDFDTADEPIVSNAYKVTEDGRVTLTREKSIPQIYHHKWLFVKDDYKGFDVEESKRRSEKWLKHTDKFNMSKIGSMKYWEEEVLPLLEGLKDKLKGKSDEEINKLTNELNPNYILARASKLGNVELIKTALEKGAGINDNIDNGSAIEIAAKNGQIPILKMLIDAGSNETNINNALSITMKTGLLRTTKVLIHYGAKTYINILCEAITKSVKNNWIEHTEYLLKLLPDTDSNYFFIKKSLGIALKNDTSIDEYGEKVYNNVDMINVLLHEKQSRPRR
jgi:ankyrin repeat protein